MEIRRFTPDDNDAVRSSLDIRNAVAEHDSPWEHAELAHEYDASLRHGWDGEPATPYLVEADGVPVGSASISMTERDNRHLAWVGVAIHPDHRRRGYGSAVFERMLEEAKAAGRTSVGLDCWESASGTAFVAKFGLERKSQAIQRRQHLAEIETGLVQRLYDDAATVASAYELVRILGRTPPEMREDMAALAAAINDAPTDDLDIEDEVMSPERLMAYEEAVLARGRRMYHLVARHRETGALGGHTLVVVDEQRPELAHQHDTAVDRDHRGHRLGLLLKAGMLLWLAEAEPQIQTVDTWNAESNDHMISVNEALGYRVMGREIQYQMSL